MKLANVGNLLFRYPNTMPPVSYVGHHLNSMGDAAGMLPHSHPHSVEVCLIQKGNIEWWQGAIIHELHPGDIFVTLPKEPHGAVDSALSPCEYLWVHLDARQLPDSMQSGLSQPGVGGLHRHSPAGRIVTEIFREHVTRDDFSRDLCQALSLELVAALVRNAQQVLSPQLSSLVKQAQTELLREDPDADSVAAVAERLFISDAWLTKRFRAEVGQTPAMWLTVQKINEAKRILRMTDVPITQIAFQLGYSSSQYFATAFRRITGRTPSEYRRLDPHMKNS